MTPRRVKSRDAGSPGLFRFGLALAFLLIAALGAGSAHADGIINTSPPPLSTLVKFDDRSYRIEHRDWVSLEPVTTQFVRKIEYGRVSEVSVAQTSTGTYSSEGMVSPYVRYPGIEVTEVKSKRRYGWAFGPGFVPIRGQGTSIYRLDRAPSGNLVYSRVDSHGFRSCVGSGSLVACYTTD